MTAETDLLPLPGLPNIGAGGQWSGWSDDNMRDYARANLAELQREVATWKGLHASEVQVRQRWQARAEALQQGGGEVALRAELAEMRGKWADAESNLAACDSDLHVFQQRAERLAEALQGIETKLVHSMDHARSSLERKRAMSECADAARAALDQENGRG